MKPIRILQVVTWMNRGGLETMLMNYYRQINREQIQFDFMVHREAEAHYDQEIVSLGGRIYRMPPIKPGNYRNYFQKLSHFFKEHSYPVVHSHMNENSAFVLRAAKQANVPCRIAHSHLSDLKLDFKLPFRLYARWMMKEQPNQYFACSKKAGEWLFGSKFSNSGKIKTLNNAVNAREFSFNQRQREEVRQELGANNRLVIGHVGRFNEQKNHDFLIDIFQHIQAVKSDTLLVLVGDGHLKSAVEQKVKKLGLSLSVRFLGVRSDISRLMQAMDLFVFPSLFEGLPVVLVEAQAAGLRCVVSDSITSEVDITKRIDFVSLKQSASTWSDRILMQSHKRKDTAQLLRHHGYDIATTSQWLSHFYMNQIKEVK